MATTGQVTATMTYGDGSTADVSASATWSSSDEGVATVDADGTVTAVADGTANISATYDGVTATAPCAVAVTTP